MEGHPVQGGDEFDIIIVGAGPAGCVLARRLTEDGKRAVALLEAGPDYGPDSAAWPVETRHPEDIYPDFQSWGYRHAERPDGRLRPLPRARVVGGSSTINACIWLRGSAADYDSWEALGNPGWSFAGLLPYFRRAEADPLGGPLHGSDGPIPIFRVARDELDPLDRALVATAESLGFTWQSDLNGDLAQHPGIGPTPKNVAGGERMHAALTYLAPARLRSNLIIFPDTLVDRVCVQDGRVTGVLTADGREIVARQVVLCAGAYGSPAILLRSGIGPADDLQRLGIPVLADMPGVGANLLDHPTVVYATGEEFCSFRVKSEFVSSESSTIATLIKTRSRQSVDDVDLYIALGRFPDVIDGSWVAWFLLTLEAAPSRGRVRLTARDPEATLDIDHAFLGEPTELEACCDGMELIARLASTRPLADAMQPIPGLVPGWSDRDELRDWVRRQVTTTFHPSSTCRMGLPTDESAVVDRAGRVYGIAGLRVADASIFPTSPRANLHCSVVAVAEKMADIIRSEFEA